MDFYEVEGKKIFQSYGIPTDTGILLTDDTDLSTITYPTVVKAQVLSGHRGQSGGVRIVSNEAELKEAVSFISALTIGGKPVAGILLTPAVNIRREHYLGITLDTVKKQRVLIYSPDGGMDIETVAKEFPDRLVRIDVTEDIDTYLIKKKITSLGVCADIATGICDVAGKLYNLFRENDCTTVEINPLAEIDDGKLSAIDSKLVIDNSALFRHPDYTILPRVSNMTEVEKEAEDAKVAYVEVDENGTTGLIVIGAGLGMATLDTAIYYGLKPYDFTDLGSKICDNALRVGMKLVMQNPNITSILINGFGGNFSTSDVVDWILASREEMNGKNIPVVVKIRGAHQEEGWRKLAEAGIPYVGLGTTDDAVKLLIKELEAVK